MLLHHPCQPPVAPLEMVQRWLASLRCVPDMLIAQHADIMTLTPCLSLIDGNDIFQSVRDSATFGPPLQAGPANMLQSVILLHTQAEARFQT